MKIQVLTSCLWLLQPLARLCGRLRYGLTPWRRRGPAGLRLPCPQQSTIWNEQWCAPPQWLQSVETRLQASGVCVRRGGPFDRWDLEVRGGLLGKARLLMIVEEHGAGKQLVRFRCWPNYSVVGLVLMLLLAALFVGAVLSRIWLLAAGVIVFVLDMLRAGAVSQGTLLDALESLEKRERQ